MEHIAANLPIFLTVADIAALAIHFGCALILTRMIEHSGATRPSTAQLMAEYRRKWMQQVPRRENRIVDASLLGSLRNGSAFFASGSMIAIGGLFAALGQTERIVAVASDFASDVEIRAEVWEMKLLFLLVLMVNTFLRFVWAHRLFGYCAVLVGAMPEQGEAEETDLAVERAARIGISAARAFNRGLRCMYFGLAALAWFLGPYALAAASLVTAAMIYRREFLSESRKALLLGRSSQATPHR
jgi:uncharacterized membrane protein